MKMITIQPFIILFVTVVAPTAVGALSSSPPQSTTTNGNDQYSESVYFDQSEVRDSIDQACYTSPLFWETVDQSLPHKKWKSDARYKRFRGFCNNLQTQTPGEEVTLPNGQQLLKQYIFPDLDDQFGVHRSAYPMQHYPELQQLHGDLSSTVAPVAERELETLLQARPLVSDDQQFTMQENDGDTWQRAAWYGWQFLSLRGATRWMPATTLALHKALTPQPAHRFVGLSRQRPECTGTVHSDGRNYMLSTLTPLRNPSHCGIVVNGIDAPIQKDAVILDNTFPHHIYNNGLDNRFCLIAECWHPALTAVERQALSILFAVKDQFTVLELALAPWGYDEESLEYALTSGAVHDLDFWRDITYNRNKSGLTEPTLGTKKKRKSKQRGVKARNKGFG